VCPAATHPIVPGFPPHDQREPVEHRDITLTIKPLPMQLRIRRVRAIPRPSKLAIVIRGLVEVVTAVAQCATESDKTDCWVIELSQHALAPLWVVKDQVVMHEGQHITCIRPPARFIRFQHPLTPISDMRVVPSKPHEAIASPSDSAPACAVIMARVTFAAFVT
jgi:hypothetical protein